MDSSNYLRLISCSKHKSIHLSSMELVPIESDNAHMHEHIFNILIYYIIICDYFYVYTHICRKNTWSRWNSILVTCSWLTWQEMGTRAHVSGWRRPGAESGSDLGVFPRCLIAIEDGEWSSEMMGNVQEAPIIGGQSKGFLSRWMMVSFNFWWWVANGTKMWKQSFVMLCTGERCLMMVNWWLIDDERCECWLLMLYGGWLTW